MESRQIWGDGESNEARIQVARPGEPIELSVSESKGAITIRTDERDDVLVRAERGGGDPDAYVFVGQEGNRIEIQPKRGGRMNGGGASQPGSGSSGSRIKIGPIEIGSFSFGEFGRGDAWFDVEVVVPQAWMPAAGGPGGRFVVRNASGDVTVTGVGGQVDALTASGAIDLTDITGHVAVNSASGEVGVTNVRGSLVLRTASGDVDIRDAALTDWVLTSASGDVDLQAALVGAGPYRIQTVNGDIDLALGIPKPDQPGEERGCVLTWQTVSGDADVEPPFVRVDRRTWRFSSPAAAATPIEVRTVTGDLTAAVALVEAEPEWEASAVATPAGPSDVTSEPADPFERGMRRVESEIESALESVDRAVADLESRFGWDLGNVRNLTGNRGRSAQPQWAEDHSETGAQKGEAAQLAAATAPVETPATPVPEEQGARGDEEQRSQPRSAEPTENWFAPEGTSGAAAAGPVAESEAQAGKALEAERLRILMALERGEMTVEEAMGRLEELDGDDRPVHAE